MKRWLRKLSGLKRQGGQTTAEYAIIVALVAVSSIAIILIFGDQIRQLFKAETTKLTSDSSETVTVEKEDTAGKEKGSINTF